MTPEPDLIDRLMRRIEELHEDNLRLRLALTAIAERCADVVAIWPGRAGPNGTLGQGRGTSDPDAAQSRHNPSLSYTSVPSWMREVPKKTEG